MKPKHRLSNNHEREVMLTKKSLKENNIDRNVMILKERSKGPHFIEKNINPTSCHRKDLVSLDINLNYTKCIEALGKSALNELFRKMILFISTPFSSIKVVETACLQLCNGYVRRSKKRTTFNEIITKESEFWFKTAAIIA